MTKAMKYFRLYMPITIILVLGFFSVTAVSEAQYKTYQCSARVYSDETYTEEAEQFNAEESVFMKIGCQNLPRGSYSFNTIWMDSSGQLQREEVHECEIESQQPYTVFFRFKLMPQGTLRQMFSGDRYSDQQYGEWSVFSYINNQEINRNQFIFY